MKQQIFISSVQSEFLVERRALHAFIKDDPLLNKFLKPFVFEIDVPANDTSKHENMRKLISEVGPQLIRRRFNSYEELKSAVNASLIRHLEETGIIQSLPFDERICPDAALDDINPKAIRQFIRLAHNKRQFSLPDSTPVTDVLAHLNLIREGHPTQAAVLLFATKTQQFVSCSEIRCMHFHGTTIQRPAPFYQTFQGTLFEQVDKAVDFILSKINLSVGIRAESTQAPTRYEVPPEVIREAIVNAVAHRDYVQPGAIQVSVFADRIEVWNPGELLAPLTIEKLRKPHRSLTRNARICEALYLVGYIEKFGTGTLMMIRESLKHALPEPDFDHETGEFVTILWRDWLTEKVMAGLHLNDRQYAVISHLKVSRQITNAQYRELTGAIAKTASRDLNDLVVKGVLQPSTRIGRGAAYHLAPKRDINRTSGKWDNNETNETLSVVKPAKNGSGRNRVGTKSASKDTNPKLGVHQVALLRKCLIPNGIKNLMEAAGRSDRTKFRNQVLKPLLNEDLLKMIIPDKPRSSKQKYQLTEKGRKILEVEVLETEGT